MSNSKVHANEKLSFEGVHIYIGMDVHKKKWVITIRLGERELTTFSIDADVVNLHNYLIKHYPGAIYHSVYEAGCFGFSIHRKLIAHGIDNVIVNPADIPTTDKDRRQKTDTRDSRKLAKELEKGTEFKGIHIPTEEEEYFRSVTRRRTQLKKERRRVMVQIRSYFTLQGIELPKEAWSKKHVAFLRERASNSIRGYVVLSLLDDFDYFNAQIKAISTEIKRLIKERKKDPEQKILKTVTGVADITSETLIAELIHPSRFDTDNQYLSYVGLIPSTASSGEKEISCGITPRRRGKLRHVLIEAAWTASSKDPELALVYAKLCKRMKKNQAIIRIARKLALRIKRVWTHMEPYRINANIEQLSQA